MLKTSYTIGELVCMEHSELLDTFIDLIEFKTLGGEGRSNDIFYVGFVIEERMKRGDWMYGKKKLEEPRR